MPTLDQIAYYSMPIAEVNHLWTKPYSRRVSGIPSNFGEWRLAAEGESLDTWKEYREADQLMLSLWDTQGEDLEIPETGQWVIILRFPRRAQSLRYRVSEVIKIPSARQPHILISLSLMEATGAETTPDGGEPLEVSLENYSPVTKKGFWVRLLPVSASGTLQVSETGEIDTVLRQKFLTRFNSAFRPGFMFTFESRPYVIQAVSRRDRRRNVTLLCNEIGGESG